MTEIATIDWFGRWGTSVFSENTAIFLFETVRLAQRHINHPPIDHLYKCHENTSHSCGPQLSNALIPTRKLKDVLTRLQA